MIKLTSSIGNINARLPMKSIIGKGFQHIGVSLVRTAKDMMNKPKHGRTYIVNGKAHTAAADGEAPAVLSGSLQKSTRFEIKGNDLLFGAGDDKTNYAKFLELGTVKMGEKPFIMASVEDNFKDIEREFEDTMKQEVRL
jgi:HK97 gp10 family phage protein